MSFRILEENRKVALCYLVASLASPAKDPNIESDDDDKAERDDLRKLVLNSNTKRNFSVSDDTDVDIEPPGSLSPTFKQQKPEINPDFLFQPIGGEMLQFPVLLPPKTCDRKFTLIVDLDETLIHYNKEKKLFYVRPYARHFLRVLSVDYEIVLFTAAMKDYTDYIIEKVDTEHKIDHRLYREHTTTIGTSIVKDLNKLGRDLSKTVIVDNTPLSFQLQPHNGIYIRTWRSDPNDRALLKLSSILADIGQREVPDIRIALQRLREKMMARFAAEGNFPDDVALSKEFVGV